MSEKRDGGELFIVDNSDSEWKVGSYLREWTDSANAFDVATGSFEILRLAEGAPTSARPICRPMLTQASNQG